MKRIHLLTTAVAVFALAACHKNTESTPVTNQTVTITESAPPPGGTWADVVNATTDGFLFGNPNAKVKLIEIGSLGCPVCKRFNDEGEPTLLQNYVKPGKVSWEFRPYPVHGPIDMAADAIAECNGPKDFYPLMQALYKDQPTWMGKVEATPQDQLAQIQNLPPNQVLVALADLAGLQDWAAARGVPHAKSTQCLTDQNRINHEVQVTSDANTEYPDFKGTPAFVLNGKFLDNTISWKQLQPQLDSAVNG